MINTQINNNIEIHKAKS